MVSSIQGVTNLDILVSLVLDCPDLDNIGNIRNYVREKTIAIVGYDQY